MYLYMKSTTILNSSGKPCWSSRCGTTEIESLPVRPALSNIKPIQHCPLTKCETTAQWLACSIEREKMNWKRGCRCLCWRNMGFGGSSQYMLVAVPLAVRKRSWMWQTQWPRLCAEGGCSRWLRSRLPAQSPSPINSFMCFPQNKPLSVWPTGNSDRD